MNIAQKNFEFTRSENGWLKCGYTLTKDTNNYIGTASTQHNLIERWTGKAHNLLLKSITLNRNHTHIDASKSHSHSHWCKKGQLYPSNVKYYPILLTCQIHTDYTVSAHAILIFERCSSDVRTIISCMFVCALVSHYSTDP